MIEDKPGKLVMDWNLTFCLLPVNLIGYWSAGWLVFVLETVAAETNTLISGAHLIKVLPWRHPFSLCLHASCQVGHLQDAHSFSFMDHHGCDGCVKAPVAPVKASVPTAVLSRRPLSENRLTLLSMASCSSGKTLLSFTPSGIELLLRVCCPRIEMIQSTAK